MSLAYVCVHEGNIEFLMFSNMVYTYSVWTYLLIGVEVGRESQHGSQGHQEKHNLRDGDIITRLSPLTSTVIHT